MKGIRDAAQDFNGVRTRERKVVALKAAKPGGSEGIFPQKILKFRVSETPFPAFSAGHFQQVYTEENASS